jgi:hypothetical protein
MSAHAARTTDGLLATNSFTEEFFPGSFVPFVFFVFFVVKALTRQAATSVSAPTPAPRR